MEREDGDAQEEAEAAEAVEAPGTPEAVEAVEAVEAAAPVVDGWYGSGGRAGRRHGADTVIINGKYSVTAACAPVKVAVAAKVAALAEAAMPAVEPVPPIPPVPSSSSDRWIRRIIDDLIKNGVTDTDDPLSFTLNKDGLIVNGARQPDDLYRLFKAKYITNPRDHFIYNHEGGSTSVEVWVE